MVYPTTKHITAKAATIYIVLDSFDSEVLADCNIWPDAIGGYAMLYRSISELPLL